MREAERRRAELAGVFHRAAAKAGKRGFLDFVPRGALASRAVFVLEWVAMSHGISPHFNYCLLV